MADVYWKGDAPAVAKVVTVQITAFDAATTYKITIGGVVVSVVGNTSVNQTATDLQVALAASTHPYFAAITWTVATDTVTGTAKVAGDDFTATSSVTGGTGTIGAVTVTTAASGPYHWDTAANWSGGSVPVSTDAVFIDRGASIYFGLDQTAVDLAELVIRMGFTSKIGLNSRKFLSDPAAGTESAAAQEYRAHYLDIGWDDCVIGESLGVNVAAGSPRIKLRNDKAGASDTLVLGTASSASESGLPAVRLLFENASAELYVQGGTAGVGVAVDTPGEVSSLSKIAVGAQAAATRVFCGEGVTLTTWEQVGGEHKLNAAATITTVEVEGGLLELDGAFAVTTLRVGPTGIAQANNVPAAGAAIVTANVEGGLLDMTRSREPRTITNLNVERGGEYRGDDYVTLTNGLSPPASGRHTVRAS